MIGASGCEILSVVDLRDAYHTLRLTPRSQQFCGITPFYGSDTYLYTRLAMGLATSPSIWSSYISTVLRQIPKYSKALKEGKEDHTNNYLCIMDDIIIFGKIDDHNQHLINLLKAMIYQGLKISPKKCQLWKKKLVYMGHYMMIENDIPCITPLKTRLEAIERLGPLKTAKNCKQFCGMVNYMSMYLQDLQKTLIPIYKLTRKGMPFHWGPEEQSAYDKVKKALISPPVLVMPNMTGHFILVSDTSKTGCGCALYQDINDRYRLVAYYSKKLPEACSRYSISELEFTGLVACISAFKHLLKNVSFTVYVDHSALVHILKGKREPPTLRIKKLLEIISQYSFDIKYLKGKEMYISDFLSRNTDNDEGSPHEIIPIAFLALDTISFPSSVLSQKLNNFESINFMLDTHNCDKCIVIKQKPAKPTTVIKHYPRRAVKKPEYFGYTPKPKVASNTTIKVKPTKVPKTQMLKQTQQQVVPTPINHKVTHKSSKTVQKPKEKGKEKGESKDQNSSSKNNQVPNLLPPVKPQVVPEIEPEWLQDEENKKDNELTDQFPNFNSDKVFELPNIIPTEADLNKRKEQLFKFINNENIFRKHIPKQHELNKFLDSLKQKVIHDFKLPLSVKELSAEYKNSPFFKDIIKYIRTGSCKYVGNAQTMFKSLCEDFILMNGSTIQV